MNNLSDERWNAITCGSENYQKMIYLMKLIKFFNRIFNRSFFFFTDVRKKPSAKLKTARRVEWIKLMNFAAVLNYLLNKFRCCWCILHLSTEAAANEENPKRFASRVIKIAICKAAWTLRSTSSRSSAIEALEFSTIKSQATPIYNYCAIVKFLPKGKSSMRENQADESSWFNYSSTHVMLASRYTQLLMLIVM